MSARRYLTPLALVAVVLAVATSCADPSPLGVAFQRGGRWTTMAISDSGLVPCTQTYDSAAQVIGPAGGLIQVVAHFLWVDTAVLSDTVTITAVAPADTVRWVRFEPDGLRFRTNGAGWSAVIYTTYKDCGVPSNNDLRIAQVNGQLGILAYLETFVHMRKNPWSNGNQYVAGILHHFSQYAVSW